MPWAAPRGVALEQGLGRVFCTRRCWLIKIPVRKVFSSGKYLLKRHLLEPVLTCIYHLCSSKRLRPPALKKLSFKLSPVKDFSLNLDDHRSFSTREQFGDFQIKFVLRNL